MRHCLRWLGSPPTRFPQPFGLRGPEEMGAARKRRKFSKGKAARRAARELAGQPPAERIIPDKRRKPPKHRKPIRLEDLY